MKNLFTLTSAILFVLFMSGCGGDTATVNDAPPAPPVIDQETPAPEEPMDEAMDEAGAETSAVEVEGDAVAAGTSIAGTTWKIDQYEVTFNEEPSMKVKMGPASLDGSYKLDGNKIELTALTYKFNGTWDGADLIIDGAKAERL